MKSSFFTEEDFHVFQVDGLDARMASLKGLIRPKLELLGADLSAFLSTHLQQEMYFHVAKHARRTVNPPEDTWVAWSTNRRGYKALPHFQVGLNDQEVFVWFALIYECEHKSYFARQLLHHSDSAWEKIPTDFYLSEDHTKPGGTPIQDLSEEQITQRLERLQQVKKAEFLCGTLIPRSEAVTLSQTALISRVEDVFHATLPLYHLALQP
ncbi:DUF1054 domain-containing protein [Hazenella sp. IB182357]|uniref:UPF0637 protein IC620_02805 n=1 Tax=Polycladospora coralii TaxID=2771432 RepID=A0A926RTF4_9BACL|nr:DUF1054 domain-containing protein [Polycladospora coralii]MBD1371282.1 DUF1054 domain-containing protein [Polycladospora coralii]